MTTTVLALINRMTSYKLLGVNAILIVGLVHLYNATHPAGDAALLTVLFLLNFVGALISSLGIAWGGRLWGWGLGGILAVGAILFYVVSRTVGIDGVGIEKWGPSLAYFSIFLELLFFVPFIAVYSVDVRRLNAGIFGIN